MTKVRATPDGKEANRNIARKGMTKIRATPDGKEANRKISGRKRLMQRYVKKNDLSVLSSGKNSQKLKGKLPNNDHQQRNGKLVYNRKNGM